MGILIAFEPQLAACNNCYHDCYRQYHDEIVSLLPFITSFNDYRPLFSVKTCLSFPDYTDTLRAVSLVPHFFINSYLLSIDVYQVKPSCSVDEYSNSEKPCGQVARCSQFTCDLFLPIDKPFRINMIIVAVVYS